MSQRDIDILMAKTFLLGQKELAEIRFSETAEEKDYNFFKGMEESYNVFVQLQKENERVGATNYQLRKQIKELESFGT